MIIKNALVYMPDGTFQKKDVRLQGNCIAQVGETGSLCEIQETRVLDGSGSYLIPGLTDIHFHGCMGKDFCDGTAEAFDIIAGYEASVGVTQIIPATMTYDEEKLMGICKEAAVYRAGQAEREDKAELCGINMEGPFIAMSKKGAQNGAYVHKPDIGMFERLNEASGQMIKLVALAPEVENAMEFIEAEHGKTVISIAHTAADYDTAVTAIGKGVHHLTHLYNAMNPMSHRAPGPIGAAADSEVCDAELICDGVHIHPATVRNTFRLFTDERIILISDSMRATGLEDGDYELGGQPVKVKGRLATLEDGTIAGSATNLMDCLRIVVKEMHLPLESAVKCAAVNSARSVGIYHDYGSIEEGKKANLVLLNQTDLSLRKVILKGKVI
ncbi:MAG: N-acetylglucosamine-6-phosphate deacetylase [Lachnospiraceae bacterium]|nr:N-acetylglucosamine-6-phosphate deacetylase [Lachnospiraceae bacterium]